MTDATRPIEVAIVGAGLGGLCAAIQLRRAGVQSIAILERASDVGGTWRDNIYPGCACDVPSHLYSFSFEPNPAWTQPYPEQSEIQAYILRLVAKYGLAPLIRLGAQVTRLTWDASAERWRIDIEGEPTLVARHVVLATGPLSKPLVPDVPGAASFAGESFHSSQWRSDVPLAGRRVAVVGTGASAVQIVPAIAPTAAHLTVLQRTPGWVLPRMNRPHPALKRWLFRHVPGLQRANRWRIYWLNEWMGTGFVSSARMQNLLRRWAQFHLDRQVKHAALRKALTPDFQPGCKRLLISNTWYPALQRPNVSLVTQAVTAVVPDGVVSADGQLHRCDVIVWATGFKASEFVAPMRVVGEAGVELSSLWRTRPAATHLGITVAGFPNLFMLVGPSTGLGHNSIIFMIEAQVRYIVQALRAMTRCGQRTLRLNPQAQAASYAQVQQRMQRTVWATGCHSWYQNEQGRIDTLWPGYTWDYWLRTRRFDASVYLR